MRRTLPGMPRLRALAPALACALLAACVQAPQKLAPVREDAAVEANRRAEAQFRRGNFEAAAQYYLEALRIAQSIEDAEGIAANAINLSIAYQRMGKFAEARASLAPVVEQKNLVFTPARLAQAALRRAVLDMDERNNAGAAEWSARAAGYCAQGCAVAGAINNVKAQLALDAGRLDEASASARAALSSSRGAGERAETANALRLLGNVAIRANDAAAAAASLNEAFAIDKELALPRKMHLDLIGLGRASALLNDRAAARSFYERALSVSEADRDAGGSAEARALIEALGAKP